MIHSEAKLLPSVVGKTEDNLARTTKRHDLGLDHAYGKQLLLNPITFIPTKAKALVASVHSPLRVGGDICDERQFILLQDPISEPKAPQSRRFGVDTPFQCRERYFTTQKPTKHGIGHEALGHRHQRKFYEKRSPPSVLKLHDRLADR